MTGFSGFVSGLIGGYNTVKKSKADEEDRAQKKRMDDLRIKYDEGRIADQQADREAAAAKRQRDTDFANAASQALSKEGTTQTTADAGGGFRFSGAEAKQRAEQFINENNDPEFGIDAQARMSNPSAASAGIRTAPKVMSETYSKAQANQDLTSAALKAGKIDEALKFRQASELAKREGLDSALGLLEAGDVRGAMDTYNKSGADRVAEIRPMGDGTYQVVGVDGSTTQVNPKELRKNLLGIQDRAKLVTEEARAGAYQAQANSRSYLKINDGQDVYRIGEDGFPKGPPIKNEPTPRVGGGGRGPGTGRDPSPFGKMSIYQLNKELDRIEVERENIHASRDSDEAKAEALRILDEEKDFARRAKRELIRGGVKNEPQPGSTPNPNAKQSGGGGEPPKSQYVFDKATGRLVKK